ncbi:MAG: (d)CMP kinase [Flavobacteriales bacterium]|jgi:cytidylate kinase|nr:(d)CMP kinase [Flavobacteriales bacterium]MBT5273429.1 (d)CMP kinase [Flavobacteriales bacterium]MBT5615967.1 (d)CMP kinase [Flavobacteriales bacterium]MBT6650646.1 (d)CMP kinase [Flavobacteriales bacterium]MBT6965136.1 (d)CMP kinase [Flavobacteriales bacterium]
MSLTFNIAIDGHSSCGKSTIAKSIAQKYGMRYIDTGAMYRAITLYFMRNDIIKNKQVDFALLSDSLDKITINFQFNSELKKSETFLNNENVESIIRGFEVSDNVSIIAQIKEVREKLILLQKAIGKSKNVVMDGRDIGTKVFPDARLKLFVTAKAEIRAQRRFDELTVKGERVTFDEILQNLNERDDHDTNRDINPLMQAEDAVLIDNSALSIQDQNDLIDNLINTKK